MVKSNRLLSLDILRGITVAGMILVNNGWGESFEMLEHSKWNGMTPCDLVFPFFLFIMGISCYLSLVKSEFKPTAPVIRRVIKRTVLLFAIGLFINWFDNAIEGDFLCFGHLRIFAVMQRIALCYGIVSLFALFCNHKYTIPVVIGLLVIYSAILVLGNGYAEDASINVLAQTDLNLFGYDHLYHKSPVDPEGLLGTISSVAHVLLGFYCGKLIRQKGSGGARRGDIKSPVLRGGGRVFGPKPRDYSFKLNKKVKLLARKSALTYKAQEDGIIMLEDFSFDAPKTKEMVNIAKNLKVDGKKLLLVLPKANNNVYLSARNLQRANVIEAEKVNTYSILNADVLVITEQSLDTIDKVLNK